MGPDQFTGVLTDQLQECMDILDSKAKEYASDTDRLANFKVAAALQGVTTRQALAGMMAKHTYSIYEMCGSDKPSTDAQWDEKITDHINYLLLLKAVTVEENSDANAEAISNGLSALRDDNERGFTMMVSKLRNVAKADLTPDQFASQATDILFP